METATQSNELVLFVEQSTVAENQKATLLEAFSNFFEQTEEWKAKAKGLVITDVSQFREMKMAREARLALKNIRVSTEHKRKELKEESLRTSQTIDAIAKIITNQIVPIEKHLEQQEKFVEIQENKRKDELRDSRMEQLAPYGIDASFYDLRNMPDNTFAELLNNSRLAHEAKMEAERKAEQERIAKEKAEAEERERVRLENERLKKEAEERERVLAEERAKAEAERKAAELAAQKEREAAEAKLRKAEEAARKEREAAEAEQRRIQAEKEEELRKEREERQRIENEMKAKAEAERKAKEEEAARIEAELSKGDKAKFDDLINDMKVLTTKYTFKSKKHNAAYSQVIELLNKTINHAISKVA